MDILVVGAGRDGTVSVAELIRQTYEKNGLSGAVIHEYEARTFYNLFTRYCETKNQRYLNEIRSLISDCPFSVVVGNGYHMVLDLILEHNPKLKILSLQRRDRKKHIESLIQIATLWPEVHVGYNADQGIMTRLCAYHLGEMTKSDWSNLSLQERFNWYCDNIYKTTRRYAERAEAYLEIYTEDLDFEKTRTDIANFTAFKGAKIPNKIRANTREFVTVNDFSRAGGRYALWWFRYFSHKDFEENPLWPCEHAFRMFLEWIKIESECAKGHAIDTAPVYGLTVDQIRAKFDQFDAFLEDCRVRSETLKKELYSIDPAETDVE